MRRITFLLITLLISICAIDSSARDYWGLRNINTRIPDSVYVEFDADYYAFPVSWARTEQQDDEFTWEALDNSLDFAERVGFYSTTVLVVSCDAGWATGGETRAPDDLDRRTPLADDPPEHGYSESLYDFAFQLMEHIGERDIPWWRYLRFVNEPDYNWVVGGDWEQDVEDYIRCLRTFYIAAHAAAEGNNISVYVSHGGFNLSRCLVRKYFLLGEEDEELQDSLITLLQSRFERHATRINNWDDVTHLAEGRGGMPPTYWADVIAGQTEWLDWFDIHYHFKPWFIFDELEAFEEAVEDSGGELKPWLAAEAAMQLAEGSLTEYNERFHACDMVRKWIHGMAFGLEGICTPMTGFPPEHFFGLFDDQQQEYQSAQAYRFMRRIIEPWEEPDDFSDNMFRYYRFREAYSIVDVVWCDALSDTSDEMDIELVVEGSDEFTSVAVYNILGEVIARIEPNSYHNFDIDQEPIIIIREMSRNVKREDTDSSPACFRMVSIYPNPFNAVVNVDYYAEREGHTSVTVHDLVGRQATVMFDGKAEMGFNRLSWDGSGFPAGVYLVRIDNCGVTVVKKIVLLP